MDEAVLHYVAGLFDADGCISTKTKEHLSLSIGQSTKGKAALEFIQKHFGGFLRTSCKESSKHQEHFKWEISENEAIIKIMKQLEKYSLIKRREIEVALQYPITNPRNFEISAVNINSHEKLNFNSILSCAKKLGIAYEKIVYPLQKTIKLEIDNWELTKTTLTKEEIKHIKAKRQWVINELKRLKKISHDDIPSSFVPHKAYLAGFADGEACFQVAHKSSHHHSIGQKYRPILDVFHRCYEGSICQKKKGNFEWTVNTRGKEFLEDILPYLIGKKKQAELILTMKTNEAPEIHKLLREMKGNYNKQLKEKVFERKLHKKPKQPNRSSSYRGVSKCGKKWRAGITFENKKYDLRTYTLEIDAAKAYNKKAIELFGDDACLNEIPNET